MKLGTRGSGGKFRPVYWRPRRPSAAIAALSLLILILGLVVVVVVRNKASGVASAKEPLTWSPPSCGDQTHACIDLRLTDTGSSQYLSLESDNDYRIHLPVDRPLRGGIQLRNAGRNVIIIGGQIDLTVPCSDDTSDCHGIMISKQFGGGHVYIEGVWIRNPTTVPEICAVSGMPCSTGDGIVVDDDPLQPTDVTLQNVRIDGISGCSGGSDHADVFHPYAAPGAVIHVDHLTGTTNCQGMHVDPDLAYAYYGEYAKSIFIKNVNLDVTPNPYTGNINRYATWLTYQEDCNSGQISLENFHIQEPDGTLNHAAWPDVHQPEACKSVWDPVGRMLHFPNSPQISGVIHSGVPAGGDFVRADEVGLDYLSPGYR
jgi:hypothetical protein